MSGDNSGDKLHEGIKRMPHKKPMYTATPWILVNQSHDSASSIYANGTLWVLPDRVWDQPKTGGSGCGFGFVMASFAGTSEQTRSFRGIRLRSVVPAIPNYMLESKQTTHKDPRHTTNPNSKNRQETQSAGNTCAAPQPYRRDRRSIEDSDTLPTSVDPLPSIISLQR